MSFTEQTPLNNEISGAINFCLSNHDQYAESRDDSECSEPATRQPNEILPFASTETTFSTNPFLPRMTDPAGISSSWHNNIISQNELPTYLPSPCDSFMNVETSQSNGSRNALSSNQNSGLASSSSHLNHRSWDQPGLQRRWASSSGNVPLSNHTTRTTQWEEPRANQISDINNSSRNHSSRTTDSRGIFNFWSGNSNSHCDQPTYLPNYNGIFGQPQLVSNSSSSLLPSNQPNQRIISETTPTTEISNPNCVVITTVERRYIYGREATRSEEANAFDSYIAGPSYSTTVHRRNNGNYLMNNCNGRLHCVCSRQYRSHPYMSVPNLHDRRLNLEIHSDRLGTQIANHRSSISRNSTELPPFESLNFTPTGNGMIERTSWMDSPIARFAAHEAASRRLADPFSIDLTTDESISIDNLRPSLSTADMEGLPNLIGTIQAGLNYPHNERMEYTVNNLSSNNSVNNSAQNLVVHHPHNHTIDTNTFVETAYRPQLIQFEMQMMTDENSLIRSLLRQRSNGMRTGRRQSENMSVSKPALSSSAPYKRKYQAFKSQLKPPIGVPKNFEIKIKRSNILEDSYRVITTVDNIEKLKAKLWVVFDGESGLDYGGVQREWFCLLSREIFNPNYGLFQYCSTNNYSLQINPYSGICNEEHLNYFLFIGRIVGMAVYHERLLDASFTLPFYKMLLQKKVTLEDMKKVDPQYYQSLSWIQQNDPTHLDLDFTVNEERLGEVSLVELIPNGLKIPVTNENKHDYINLFIKWRLVKRVKNQMQAFLMGFHDIIPRKSIQIFQENELESLICGIQQLDLKDWRSNTAYSGGYYPRHSTIRWFWKVVSSFDNEMRAKLLQFVTGSSRVPMNGFKELIGSNGPLLFTIQKLGTSNSLPRSHTCFNRLDLPPYESLDQLKHKLIQAIEGCEGFGGVD